MSDDRREDAPMEEPEDRTEVENLDSGGPEPVEEPRADDAPVDESNYLPSPPDPADPAELPEDEEPEEVTADIDLHAEAEMALLATELEMARRERDEYLDALRRLKAEFDNSRKRLERERERLLQSASERLIGALLPVLDNLDRALEAEGDLREGVRATREQLVGVLQEEGLSPIASDGEVFDPNVHEAVMGQVSEEHEDGTILQTFERGYVLNGRAIRPAKVVVARQG